jgi:hypothetical protein
MHQDHIAKVTESQMKQNTPGGATPGGMIYEDGVMFINKPMPEEYRNVPFLPGFYQPYGRSMAQGGG